MGSSNHATKHSYRDCCRRSTDWLLGNTSAAAWGYITDQQAEVVTSDLAALGGRLYGLSRR